MLFGGVFFTVFVVGAWKTDRCVGAMFLAVLTGVYIALAIQFLMRFHGKWASA